MAEAATCWCGREIPVLVLWTAFSRRSGVKCSKCSKGLSKDDLARYVDNHEYAKANFIAYQQVVRFGWTSAETVLNAEPNLNPQMIGALFTGLCRTGLIQRYEGDRASGGAVFEAGPRFPGESARLGQQLGQ